MRYILTFPEWASNFHPSPLNLQGGTYPTVEHGYQASKTPEPEWRERIRTAETPGQAKRLGRKAPLRPDWDRLKYPTMVILLKLKFAPGTELGIKLMEHEGPLIELNDWHDNTWGICTCAACPGYGQNLLGKALAQVRMVLRS